MTCYMCGSPNIIELAPTDEECTACMMCGDCQAEWGGAPIEKEE